MVSSSRSREETRFLALLAKTQERAANLGASKKANNVRRKELDGVDVDVVAENESAGEDEEDWRLPKVGLPQIVKKMMLFGDRVTCLAFLYLPFWGKNVMAWLRYSALLRQHYSKAFYYANFTPKVLRGWCLALAVTRLIQVQVDLASLFPS